MFGGTIAWIAAGLALAAVAFVIASYLVPESLLNLGKELARRGARMTRKHVKAAGHDFVYFERGQRAGRETVVLLHGFSANKDGWLQYARGLGGYHLVIPDLPGFGDSEWKPAERYGFVEQAARLKAFVDALGLAPFHIAGNSMGGGIAGVYAATYPGDVKTVLLMDATAVDMPVLSDYLKQVEAGSNPLIVRSIADVDVLLAHVFVRPPPLPSIAKRIFASEGMSRVQAYDAIFQHLRDDQTVLEPLLPKVEAPTLVMWGKQDRVLDVSMVQVFERGLPRRRTVIYERCGHLPHLEMPAQAARDHRELIDEGA